MYCKYESHKLAIVIDRFRLFADILGSKSKPSIFMSECSKVIIVWSKINGVDEEAKQELWLKPESVSEEASFTSNDLSLESMGFVLLLACSSVDLASAKDTVSYEKTNFWIFYLLYEPPRGV